MEEIWKDIDGYEGMYQISSHGRARGIERSVRNGNGTVRVVPQAMLRQSLNSNGYLKIRLCGKNIYVHRAVGAAFVYNDNPEIKNQINHINEDKQDNMAENLEWCTCSYNLRYGKRNEKMIITRNRYKYRNSERPIEKYTLSGEYICEYESMAKASRLLNISEESLWFSCNSNNSSCCGFQWKYKDSNKKIAKYVNHKLRRVAKYDTNMKKIEEYESIALAARMNNISASGIHNCCKKLRNSIFGFKWGYL